MLQILDTRMGFPSPSLNVVLDYFSHSCIKMCKICLKRTLDVTFQDCLALTFCDVIGELLPEWACLTLQGGTTFLLTSKLADIPVSRVRNACPRVHKIHNGHAFMISKTFTCVQYMPCYGNNNDGIMPFTKRLCAGFKKIRNKNFSQTKQLSKQELSEDNKVRRKATKFK